MLRYRFCAFALLSLAAPAWSQAHSFTESQYQRFEIYGGPVFAGSNPTGDTYGGGFGVGGNFARWAGVMGEFTLLRGSCCSVNTTTLTDYLVGPRVAKPFSASSRLGPFADVLFGGQTLNNSSNHHTWMYSNGTGPAIAADGGVDVRLTRRLAIRAELGLVHSWFIPGGGGGTVSNDRWRAASYVVYRF